MGQRKRVVILAQAGVQDTLNEVGLLLPLSTDVVEPRLGTNALSRQVSLDNEISLGRFNSHFLSLKDL